MFIIDTHILYHLIQLFLFSILLSLFFFLIPILLYIFLNLSISSYFTKWLRSNSSVLTFIASLLIHIYWALQLFKKKTKKASGVFQEMFEKYCGLYWPFCFSLYLTIGLTVGIIFFFRRFKYYLSINWWHFSCSLIFMYNKNTLLFLKVKKKIWFFVLGFFLSFLIYLHSTLKTKKYCKEGFYCLYIFFCTVK